MHGTPPAVLFNVQHWVGVEARDMVEGGPDKEGRFHAWKLVEVLLQGQVVTGKKDVDPVMAPQSPSVMKMSLDPDILQCFHWRC